MKKIITSIKQKPINLILIVIVLFLYTLNNLFLKKYTQGIIQLFLRCHFNDLILLQGRYTVPSELILYQQL